MIDKKEMVRLAERMVKPELSRILDAGLTQEELQTEIVMLTMALGFGLALVANASYQMTPEMFGKSLGEYVTANIKHLQEMGIGNEPAADGKEGSAWG